MSKIIFAGDSITQGGYCQESQRFSTLVGQSKGFEEIINAGVDTDTVTGLYNRLQADIILQNPDVVAVMIGRNDVGNSQTPVTSLATYRSKLEQVVISLKNSGIRVCLLSWLVGNHAYWGGVNTPAYLDIISQVAHKNNIGYIPIYEMWASYKWASAQTVEEYDALYYEPPTTIPGIHPSALGHQVIADFILSSQFDNQLTVEPPITNNIDYPAVIGAAVEQAIRGLIV